MGKNLYFHLYIFFILYFSIEFFRGSVGVLRIGTLVHGPVREVVRGPSPLDWSTDRGSG